MTAPVTSYTTTDSVRGCLGITDNEMSDSMLSDMGLGIAVISELEEWLPDHSTNWTAFSAASPSTTETAIGRSIRLYCSWTGAMFAIKSYLAIPHEVSDGKSSMARFAAETPKHMEKTAAQMSNKYRLKILDLLDTPVSSASVMGKASPSYDPITNAST